MSPWTLLRTQLRLLVKCSCSNPSTAAWVGFTAFFRSSWNGFGLSVVLRPSCRIDTKNDWRTWNGHDVLIMRSSVDYWLASATRTVCLPGFLKVVVPVASDGLGECEWVVFNGTSTLVVANWRVEVSTPTTRRPIFMEDFSFLRLLSYLFSSIWHPSGSLLYGAGSNLSAKVDGNDRGTIRRRIFLDK